MTTSRRPSGAGGFTLVELMVTIAIIGVFGLLTVPGLLSTVPTYRVNGATRALATELNLARNRAVTRNRVHHVAFDPTGQSLVVWEDEDNNWSTANTSVQTVSFATAFPGVRLGYNAALGLGGTAITQAATFGTTASPVRATLLPNGLAAGPGVVYLIPTVDVGTSRSDRMRAVQVGRGGQVSLHRFGASGWESY